MSDKEEPQQTKRLELAYQQVCTSYEAITDFRGKLLALLPLATGTAAALLIGREPSVFLGPLGLFGIAVTAGLYMYEFRGIQRCHRLEKQARTLERKLELSPEVGQFRGQPPRRWKNMLGPPGAGLVVYLAVIFAWLYVAIIGFSVGFGWRHNSPWRFPLVLLLVLIVVYAVALPAAWRFMRKRLDKWAGPNGDLMCRAYEAYAYDDFGRLAADKITFHQLQQSGTEFQFKVHDVLVIDAHIVVLLLGTARRAGKRIEQKVVHVLDVNADGKVVDCERVQNP